MTAFWTQLVELCLPAGTLPGIGARATLLLAVAWLLHAALARANPRWRVLLWRVAALGLILLPLSALRGPAISLAVLSASEPHAAVRESHPRSRAAASAAVPVPPSNPGDWSDTPIVASPTTHSAAPQAAEPSATSPVPVPAPRVNWLLWAGLIYALGIVIGVLREFAGHRQLRALVRRSSPVGPRISDLGRHITAQLGCRWRLTIRQTRELDSPCLLGIWRPLVLLPEVDCPDDGSAALTAILAHEISHIRGRDLAWNAVLRMLSVLLWFHPLIWRTRSAHAAACDGACDAVAAHLIGDVTEYGRTLARLALRVHAAPAVSLAMARPSGVRLRIEALQRRLFVARLSRGATVASIAAGLLLALLCGAVSLTRAANAVSGLSVSGRVFDEREQPVGRATVYVYSAGVRVGSSPYCPTCYADCGKRVTTDSEGRFRIAGLDPALIFRLLAVANGYRPTFASKVDPQADTPTAITLSSRPTPDDPTRVVRGQVIDPDGKPAVGALVESFGCQAAERRWWGQMDGVDPLAVTDEQGKFSLICDEPVGGLDLKVEHRGAVRRNFELVKSNGEEHKLQLDVGVTVEGRLLDHGKPLPGIAIGICQKDRSVGKFLGPYQIGTDADGRFSLPNLPAGEDLFIYGIMDTLHDRGALAATKFTSSSGATTNMGDLALAPAHTLAGKIALTDGKPVPAHTRVMISREGAWDSRFVEAATDGSFSVDGIPAELIKIHVSIKGYRLSSKNKSVDPLNPSSLMGVVSDDVGTLTILYEPGKPERVNYENSKWQIQAEKHKRIKTQPLAGVAPDLSALPTENLTVTAGPAAKPSARPAPKPLPRIEVPPPQPPVSQTADGPTRKISGTVTDAASKPIENAQLWFPALWISPFETLTATVRVEGARPFEMSVPTAWLPAHPAKRRPIVWAYSPGHAIGTFNAGQQLWGDTPPQPFEVQLPPLSDVSFVVRLPDGRPAVGARIVPVHFKTSWASDYVPQELVELVAGTTDADGRAATPALTRDGLQNVDVTLEGYGTQRFRCDMSSTGRGERTLQLRAVGRLEGRIVADQLDLVRGMFVTVETEALEGDHDLLDATGTAIVKVDEQGKFVISEIAAGRAELFAKCDERLPVRPRLPERGALTLLPGETTNVEIPLEMTALVRGVVRAKDTKQPFPEIMVYIRYGSGHQGEQAVTNANGEYSAPALAGDVYVQVISLPDGYAQLGEPWNEKHTIDAEAQQYGWPDIELAPTKSLSGKVLDKDGKPLPDVQINGNAGNRRYAFGKSNAQGEFTISGVPLEITLETFEIWTRDEHFVGKPESTEPLVVRVQPK